MKRIPEEFVRELRHVFANLTPEETVDYYVPRESLHPMMTDPVLADLPFVTYAEPPADGWYCEEVIV